MIYTVNCPVIVSTLLEHSTVKNQLLEIIDKIPASRIDHNDSVTDIISKTDWNIDESIKEQYLEIIKPTLISHIAAEFKKFNSNFQE